MLPAALTLLLCGTAAGGWISYLPGTLPVVLSAPHGGSERPASIPDRHAGCWVNGRCVFDHQCQPRDTTRCGVSTAQDVNTLQLTTEISEALFGLTGARPHVILNQLHRIKLDANRDIGEAAQGVAEAEEAWRDFQDYVNQATNTSFRRCNRGLYIDVHGHAHSEQWIEFGYLLTTAQLNLEDSEVDKLGAGSSIAGLAAQSPQRFSQLLRGPDAVGTLVGTPQYGGYKAVPSAGWPSPGTGQYFSGGYNTAVHGSRYRRGIDGVQMEVNSDLRRSAPERQQFASDFARVLLAFFQTHYQLDLQRDPCGRAGPGRAGNSTTRA